MNKKEWIVFSEVGREKTDVEWIVLFTVSIHRILWGNDRRCN